jgi:hypothetical protein
MTDQLPDVVHPIRGGALSPLERELWRLRMVALESQVMLRGYFSVPNVAESIPDGLLFSLANHALIIVAKFLEVWHDFGTLVPNQPRVLDVRRAVTPFVKRIEIWKGLRTFRNTALAHPYTTLDGRLVGPWYLMEEHRAPTYHAEVILLLQCVMYAVAGTLAGFSEEYKALGPSFRSAEPVPDGGPGIQVGVDIDGVIHPLLRQVEASLQAIGVPPSSPVFAEFRAVLKSRDDT